MSGPLVYGDYEQRELDAQYDAAGTVPSVEPYFERYAAESARVRAAFRHEADVAYGSGERETLDLFPAHRSDAPLFVFAHGGYWRRLSKDFFSFAAELVVRAGGAAAILNYPLAPAATLDEIVRAARTALVWLTQNAARANADPQRVVVGGHSAGGQLCGMLAADDWTGIKRPAAAPAGVVALSGLFDLEPVRRSQVNEWMRMDPAVAARNSPLWHLPARPLPLVAAVGARETDEFRRQTRDYTAAWRARGYQAEDLELDGHNHFSIVFELTNAESPLARALLRMLQL